MLKVQYMSNYLGIGLLEFITSEHCKTCLIIGRLLLIMPVFYSTWCAGIWAVTGSMYGYNEEKHRRIWRAAYSGIWWQGQHFRSPLSVHLHHYRPFTDRSSPVWPFLPLTPFCKTTLTVWSSNSHPTRFLW